MEAIFSIYLELLDHHESELVEINGAGTVNINFFHHFLQLLWRRVLAEHGKEATEIVGGDGVLFDIINEDFEGSLNKKTG